jgi:hypothetical protein
VGVLHHDARARPAVLRELGRHQQDADVAFRRERRVLRVGEERQVGRIRAVERRDPGDLGRCVTLERAADCSRNGFGGEDPRALTAEITRR